MSEETEPKPIIIRNSTDLQRLKLDKLMQNPDKPVIIPERPKERGIPVVPDFVRNVMGSSAGAGSGEFHVYRHLRRKEYARQRFMKEKGEREKLDNEYWDKLDSNKKEAEDRTLKKRQKRLKKKQNQKGKKPKVVKVEESDDTESTDKSDDEGNVNKAEHNTNQNKSDAEQESIESQKSDKNEAKGDDQAHKSEDPEPV